jgi:phosphatidylinositol-3-phosphatase
MRLARALAGALVAVSCLAATGCQGGSAGGSGSSASTAEPTKVLVIVEENHSYQQMKDGMPYLFALSTKYGYATHFTAIRHPSEPNYLAIAGGSTFSITDDRSPAANSSQLGSAKSVFDQALDNGKTAKAYAEDMPKPCHVYDYPADKPSYAVRHNPWVYFDSSRQRCLNHDVPLTDFSKDATGNQLPNIGFLAPNLCHDAHSCPLSSADDFLKSTLPAVLDSDDFTSGRLVVVVTADEDDKHSGNEVLTSVLSTRLSHKVVTSPLTHYSLSRYLSEVAGAQPLLEAAKAPDMRAAFGL